MDQSLVKFWINIPFKPKLNIVNWRQSVTKPFVYKVLRVYIIFVGTTVKSHADFKGSLKYTTRDKHNL